MGRVLAAALVVVWLFTVHPLAGITATVLLAMRAVWRRKGCLIGVMAVLLVLGLTTGLASPAVPYQHTGWRWTEQDLPMAVDLGGVTALEGVPTGEVKAAARRAIDAWNRAAGRILFVEGQGAARLFVGDCGEGAAGHAAVQSHRGRALWAEVCINRESRWSTSGEPGRFDLETLLVHELGHVLGLAHPVRSGSDDPSRCLRGPDRVMCSPPTGMVLRVPQAGDVAGLQALYGTPP